MKIGGLDKMKTKKIKLFLIIWCISISISIFSFFIFSDFGGKLNYNEDNEWISLSSSAPGNPHVSASTFVDEVKNTIRGDGEIDVEFEIPGYYLKNVNGRGYVVDIPGCVNTGEKGAPAVPAYLIKLALPPNAKIKEIIPEDDTSQALSIQQLAIVEPYAMTPSGAKPMAYEKKELIDSYPGKRFKFHTSRLMDGNTEGTLVIYPVQYEPGNGFTIHYFLKLKIKFSFRSYTEEEKEAMIPPAWKEAREMFSWIGEVNRGERYLKSNSKLRATSHGTAYEKGYSIETGSPYLSSLIALTTWHKETGSFVKPNIYGLHIESKGQDSTSREQEFESTFGTAEKIDGKLKIFELVKSEWSESEGVVVYRVGDSDCEVAATPLASYMNWPLIPYEESDDAVKVKEIANSLGAKFVIIAGNVGEYEKNQFYQKGYKVILLEEEKQVNLLNTYFYLEDWKKGIRSNLPDPIENFYKKEIANKDFNHLMQPNSLSGSQNISAPFYTPGGYLVLFSEKDGEMNYRQAAQILGSYRGAAIVPCSSFGSPDLVRNEIDYWVYQYVALMGDGDPNEIPAWDIYDPIDDLKDSSEYGGQNGNGIILSDFYYELDLGTYNSWHGTNMYDRTINIFSTWGICYYVGRVVGIDEQSVINYVELIKKYEFGLTNVNKDQAVTACQLVDWKSQIDKIGNYLQTNGDISTVFKPYSDTFTPDAFYDILENDKVTVAYVKAHGTPAYLETVNEYIRAIDLYDKDFSDSPFLFLSVGCNNGEFMGGGDDMFPDETGSLCVHFLSRGAIASIGSSMISYNGSTMYFAEHFFKSNITSEDLPVGYALACTKKDYWDGAFRLDYDKKTVWEFILIGDPAVNIQMGNETNPTTNHSPVLTNPIVDPSSGNTLTKFHFEVFYQDEDGDFPTLIQCHINGPNNYSSDLAGSRKFGIPGEEWWKGTYLTDGVYLPYGGTYNFQWKAEDEYGGKGNSSVVQFSVSASSSPTETEPNNDPNSANLLTSGTTLKGINDPVSDIDWYKIYCPSGGHIRFRFRSPSDTGHEAALLDINLNELKAVGTSPGEEMTIDHDTLTEGTFYLRVRSDPLPGGYYTIVYTFTPSTPVLIRVFTDPTDKQIIIDGFTHTSPKSFNWNPGSMHTLDVESPQGMAAGMRYAFDRWSDGEAKYHQIYVPRSNTDYTATFKTQYLLKTSANPSSGGSVTPSGESWKDATTPVTIQANANPGYIFSGWEGSFQGTENPLFFYMGSPKNITANFVPEFVSVTITSSPAGRQVSVGGVAYTTPQTFQWNPGSQHDLDVLSPQDGGPGIRYVFNRWSDEGSQAHSITVPTTNITYIAYFDTQYLLTTSVNLPEGGSVTPSGSNWYNSGNTVDVQVFVNTGYDFTGWSGDGQGTDNPLVVTMDRPKEIIANFKPECIPPAVPSNPSPPDGSTICFTPNLTLTWTANGATFYDVYFGTSPTPPLVATTFTPSMNVMTFSAGTYYWRITAKNCGETPGPTWRFTVITPPGVFSYLSPANGAQGIAVDTDLDWGDSSGVLSYDVYFGTSSPPAYIDNTFESFYDLPQLECQTQYYWKIVAKNACGNTAGEEYHFTTEACMGPHIFSIVPSTGQIGTEVTIYGTNFGSTRGVVVFNDDVNAPIPTAWSDSQITTKIPNGANTGPVFVRTTERRDSNEVDFTVLRPVEKGLLAEDFESYAVGTFPFSGGWQLINSGWGTQYQEIDNSNFISAPQSLKMEGSTNWAASIVNEFLLPDGTPNTIYYEFWVKVTRLENPVMWSPDFRFWAGKYGGNSHSFGSIDFQPNQLLSGKEFLIFNGVQGPEVNLGQWYKVKIKYDLQSDIGDVWLSDTLVFSQVPLGTTTSHYFEPAISFEGGNDCHTRVWVDDVNVYGENLEGSTLTVTSPNGGERWESGSTQDITWNHTGNIENVKIEFSEDGGLSWVGIVDSTPNDGLYPMTAPETLSTKCLIRIRDLDDTLSDMSNSAFSIAESSSVTVTSPNGGENLEVGSTYNITWNTTGMIASVKIEFSSDNGTFWKDIVNSTANNGSYNWNVPDSSSGNCLIRIIDNDGEGNASDVSDAVFSIVSSSNPTITVTSPNGGENWDVGSMHNITWRSTGTVGKVKIEYSTDKGSGWRKIVTSTPNDGNFSWTVPARPSPSCMVRVSETDGQPVDASDLVFVITGKPRPIITVISPNGGETLNAGNTHKITWAGTRSVGNVEIEYSTDRGSSWKTVSTSTANDGGYDWKVPNDPSDTCLLRISEIGMDEEVSDVTDSVFSIVLPTNPTLTLISPNGGEALRVGSSCRIAWSSIGTIGNVRLEYCTQGDASWMEIAAAIPNNGVYDWTVPDNPSMNCLIRISEADGEPSDISDTMFSIVSAPFITITSPNGGETWGVFSSQNITWAITGTIVKVRIEYSIDGGTSWETIITCAASSGSFTWTVPDTLSSHCLVRISDYKTDGGISDISNAEFSIVLSSTPSLHVASPNGGERLMVGSIHEITWAHTGTIENVKIEYSIDGGMVWADIIASMSNDGSFDWQVPDMPSDNCLVRISETDGEPSDVSDAAFSIAFPSTDSIKVTSPNGGESLAAGSTHKITWSSTGGIQKVIIEYSFNGGTSWNNIVMSSANDGSYEWIVPDTPSEKCLVRIRGNDSDDTPSDFSDEVFAITAEPVTSITVTAPNSGERLIVGTIYDITWQSTGTIDYVDIEYSIDNGNSWKKIALSNLNEGIFAWTVPDTPSNECLVRVNGSDSDAGPWDISDGLFSIKK
ncbi:MAG: hypothetical protein QG657_3177 [Acidobacteriota bacterium]|nr:hypothetical protein [Acidobacteriota bacterium]